MSIPDEASLSRGLLDLIRTDVLTETKDLNAQTNLFDAGLDSMAIMQLLLAIEGRYGVMLSMSDLTRDNFSTTTELARLLHRDLTLKSAGAHG